VSPTEDTAPPVPELFAGVVGQPAAVRALRAAARRPVHAYLFLGPPGSGGQPAARGFAAALLCPFGGCGRCDTCRRALAGTHPDFVLLERTGASVGIDEARRLVTLAQRKPFEADRQILVVADVHLALRSAPALLKTVEEPPASTVFILLADDLPPELVTVASRCVEVAFPPLSNEVVRDWLVGQGTDELRAALVAEGAAGNLDRARLLTADDRYLDRLELWRSLPATLDGTGAVAGQLAKTLFDSIDAALAPLRAEHKAELAAVAEEAERMGEKGLPGKKEITDRHSREERRFRTDELIAGLAVLARAYRDRLVGAATAAPAAHRGIGTVPGRRDAEAVDRITKTAASLQRNPVELLALEGLLVRLGDDGE